MLRADLLPVTPAPVDPEPRGRVPGPETRRASRRPGGTEVPGPPGAPEAPASAVPSLRRARAADLDAVEALLRDEGLPLDGVAQALTGFVVAEVDGTLAGVAGLEVHGSDGVLRSVAVVPGLRGRGLGARLTGRVLRQARDAGLRRVYLLTTTAEGWFPRLGFRVIPREEASPEARRSIEFREACPASAVAMVLDLENRAGPDGHADPAAPGGG